MLILDTVQTLCQCVRYAFKSSSIIRAGDSKFSNSKRVMLIGFVFIEMQGGPRKVLHRDQKCARHFLPTSFDHATRSSICTYSYFIPFQLLIIFEKKKISFRTLRGRVAYSLLLFNSSVDRGEWNFESEFNLSENCVRNSSVYKTMMPA